MFSGHMSLGQDRLISMDHGHGSGQPGNGLVAFHSELEVEPPYGAQPAHLSSPEKCSWFHPSISNHRSFLAGL